jgi:alcohol dehydrogenase
MGWTFHQPGRVIAGEQALAALPSMLPAAGPVLLVTSAGARRRGLPAILAELEHAGRLTVLDQVTPNPELDFLDDTIGPLRQHAFGAVVAIGGGSVIDAAKVIAVALAQPGTRPLHAALRSGQAVEWRRDVALVAIPTTSGTGAEVTPFATVWDCAQGAKYSVAGAALVPDYAVLDPRLTYSLPYQETLHTALDALSHAVESLWNVHRNPVSSAFAQRALQLGCAALPRALAEPGDAQARASLQEASLLAGLAISQTRTAIAHAVSYPLTARHQMPHGLACSFTLGALIDFHLAQAPADPFRPVLEPVRALLATLGLKEEVARYASREQVLAQLPSMFNPSRAGNFLHPLGAADLCAILEESLL